MHLSRDLLNRFSRNVLPAVLASMALAFGAAAAVAQVENSSPNGSEARPEAPIVNPGAPGQPSRTMSAEDASKVAGARYSAADVKFMQDMIHHHHQALVMSALVPERTNRNELIDLAAKIESSQRDEIGFMGDWLAERGEDVPDPGVHESMHMHHTMEGMASPEQMAELEAAEGAAFDELFLQLMIEHHQGALTMVEDLLEQPGSAYDPVLFEFTTEVTNDQDIEIERMMVLLAAYSPDPRVGLAAGFRDAGEAAENMELVASLPKPPGFFDPENPAGMPMSLLEERAEQEPGERDEADRDEEAVRDELDDAVTERDEEDDEDDERSPLLSFSNTDMAFAGDVLVAGSYHGFNVYDIGNPDAPELVSSIVCPGGQGDVSIVGDLLLMSVEQPQGRLDCGLKGVPELISDERFIGLRIFDISDLTMPVQVGAVQTCRGSHTHSVVSGPGEDGNLIVYNSGTRPVRDEEELEGCVDEPYRGQTAMFRIDVIEIPVERPSEARIVASPAVFADPESGELAGLWQKGDHGDDTQETNETNHCHDITVFPELNLAAGACSGNGILFDISDPMNPVRIDAVVDPSFAYWHSATFNNDGTKVIFTDEWGGGGRPRCQAADPMTWGADAIFDIVDGKLKFASYYKMPAPQTKEENCVAHNGAIVPVPGRDIFVQAWYQGGVSVMDFTDSSNPFEIAFFDRGPIDAEELVMGGYWSTYWFNGRVYGTEIARGLDVFKLTPSEHLSENEIAAATLATGDEIFNPQQQFPITWPAEAVVARAYIDQLKRDGAIAEARVTDLVDVLDQVDAHLEAGTSDAAIVEALAERAKALQSEGGDREGVQRKRLVSLAGTLKGLAERLAG